MDKLKSSSTQECGATWLIDLGRKGAIVHERRKDGTSITHIRPNGGKSRLMSDLIERFCERETVEN